MIGMDVCWLGIVLNVIVVFDDGGIWGLFVLL